MGTKSSPSCTWLREKCATNRKEGEMRRVVDKKRREKSSRETEEAEVRR